MTSLVGTSGIDFASITDNEIYFVGGQESADTIGLSANVTGLTVRGGQGNDALTFSAGSTYTDSFINTNSNNDVVGAAAARANLFDTTMMGGSGNDTLFMGTVNGGKVNGNKNVDIITVASALSTTIYGGQGIDAITLNAGTHTGTLVSGDKEQDTLTLTAASTLSAVTLSGGDGNDIINGNAVMTAATGTVAQGGAGIDTINFAAFTQSVNISGGTEGDVITGGIGNDTIAGDAGGDTIVTTAGNDTVTAGTGNDTITLGAGTERVVAATGDSSAATVAWTNVIALTGFLTNNTSALTFGNGVDVVNAFTTVTDTFATGTAGATALAAASDVTALAAGNYFARGGYNAGTGAFTLNAVGADTLYLQANGASLQTAANNGTSATVFVGAILVGGDFVA